MQGKEADVANSDSVYKAFVRGWCFEESPPAAPGVMWKGLVVG